MDKKEILDRISQLREKMDQVGVSAYLILTEDPHRSEYVCDHYQTRRYYSGFTGSNGSLLVLPDSCFLWTDGRYFVQAEKELAGTGITLMRMGEPGVPSITAFIKDHIPSCAALGFDGSAVNASFGLTLEKELHEKSIRILCEEDLAGAIWADRPPLPSGEVRLIPESYFGESTSDRLTRIRARMEEKGADALFISKLDDLMWLLEIRGSDVKHTPVVMCHALITKKDATLFISDRAFADDVRLHFDRSAISLRPYEEAADALRAFVLHAPADARLWIDPEQISFRLFGIAKRRENNILEPAPTDGMKAVKTETELKKLREVYIKDSVILTRFIRKIKALAGEAADGNKPSIGLNEYEAGEMLDRMRLSDPDCYDLSFSTIAAYGPNAAMMHYKALPDDNADIRPEGFLLVDSGGQYMGGTTDVTRTIVMGPLSDAMRKHFTLSLVGMLRLAHAHFLKGCTGRNLDILAREPLWEEGIDYKCGTGHGIGYMLGVHEGPQNIRWRYNKELSEAELVPGMIVSDEPGVYKAGAYGIRIENILEVTERETTPDGTFYGFRHLTYVPIDPEAVDVSLMTPRDISLLNTYQRSVYETLSQYLNEDERAWLRDIVKPL